jgi:pre-mRNA-processing factor SLU7
MSRSNAPPPPSNSTSQSRNEYIPSFISKKPFYIDDATTDADYLEHQRLQSAPKDTLDKAKWYERGRKLGPAATKFRKGACENCGAMTHKTKECLSRPRKQGAKWTGQDIQADEVVDEVKLGWDAKRDRWNGYDSREYSVVVKEYEELEALKRAAKGESDPKFLEGKTDADTTQDETRYGEETDMGRNQPTSTRQLRLREDTAAYLKDLNLDSAKYDPKTRSMDTTTQTLNASDPSSSIAEEGFIRASSDAAEFERAQRYAWESQESSGATTGGKKLHLQANPTEGEIIRKKQTQEAETRRSAQRKALLDKYGGAKHLDSAPTKPSARVLENEAYVEYDATGSIKGQIKSRPKSKYPEDVLSNNHTSVWGSWWRNFVWGYACCHSTTKNSYCTGEEGRQAFEEAEAMRTGETLLIEAPLASQEQQGESKDEASSTGANITTAGALKKRTLQEMRDGISEAELETYKRSRNAANDPMAAILGRDELI